MVGLQIRVRRFNSDPGLHLDQGLAGASALRNFHGRSAIHRVGVTFVPRRLRV